MKIQTFDVKLVVHNQLYPALPTFVRCKTGQKYQRIFYLKLSKISKGGLKEILIVYLDPKLQRNLNLCNFMILNATFFPVL
jgi:hypothetical protein